MGYFEMFDSFWNLPRKVILLDGRRSGHDLGLRQQPNHESGGDYEPASAYWNLFSVVHAWLSLASRSGMSTDSPSRIRNQHGAGWATRF
jgi:hypothetical protein